MSEHLLETKRHSVAHLVAAATEALYPSAKFGIGPTVENGFYYDIDFPEKIEDEVLKEIEKKTKHVIKQNLQFVRSEIKLDEAIKMFTDKKQSFKVELLQDLKEHGTTKMSAEELQDTGGSVESVSIYQCGDFVDLCRGPHVENTNELNSDGLKLMRLAGAYWRGKNENPQLTRLYGVYFNTKVELDAHLKLLTEAEKRDHKKLGPELDLFTFSELVGAGLPLWTPKGALIRNILDQYVWDLRLARGYEKVEIPHITKKELYEKSGHWDKFKDELFKITTREGHEFAMKPMNCPHHTQIYARRQWSYREIPQRYANTTTCYRDEQTGELSGISRTRAFSQDDAHVFCRINQTKVEFLKIWDIIHEFYSTFNFQLKVRLSLHDPAHPEKYLGGSDRWLLAENILHEIIVEKKVDAFEGVGEAAFYGPKLDFMAEDSLGRKWQVATIQLDMNMPERFDLTCVNEGGEHERIVMIHAAIMGSIERFMSIMIEHFAGNFPIWLAPVQVLLVCVAEKHVDVAMTLATELKTNGVRVEVDDTNETMGKKIRKATSKKIPYVVVVGEKELAGEDWTVRIRGVEKQLKISMTNFISKILSEIKGRK